jgi:arylsulfatase
VGRSRQWEALRDGRWKIVRRRTRENADPGWELYDLAADAYETTDLAARRPERVERPAGLLEAAARRDARPGRPEG